MTLRGSRAIYYANTAPLYNGSGTVRISSLVVTWKVSFHDNRAQQFISCATNHNSTLDPEPRLSEMYYLD